MDLTEAKARLYGLPPESFLAHRTELVAEARAVKDRELVKQIGQLRRPTRTAWLLNLLARSEPDQLSELLSLRDSLGQAQREGDGVQLRALSAQRRKLIEHLTRLAFRLGEDAGYSPPDSAIPELGQTLHAALADPGIRDSLLAGALIKPAQYGGFGFDAPTHTEPGSPADSGDLMALLAASLPKDPPPSPPVESASAPSASPRSPGPEPGEDAVGAQRERRAEQKRRTEAERLERDQRAERERLETASRQAQLAADQAESEADHATAEANKLAKRVGSLREELSSVEAAARGADETARGSRAAARKLRQHAIKAEAEAPARKI